MQFDFSGAYIFLSYLAGKTTVEEVLNHPAYRVVCHHADHWNSTTITGKDIEDALAGLDSPFYGLSKVRGNEKKIVNLMNYLEEHAPAWSNTAVLELRRLLPAEDVESIIVYPIIGYDAGIGLSNAVCMNLNFSIYHDHHPEFLSTMIHEGFHVIYERIHGGRAIRSINNTEDWLTLFMNMLQNEGYAVYAPIKMREGKGYPIVAGNPLQNDYALLQQPHKLQPLLIDFWSAHESITYSSVLTREDYLNLIFGPKRITYRIGCEIIRRIEQAYGYAEVQKAVYHTGKEFFANYSHLIKSGQ